MNQRGNVLIAGASFAGLSTAFWMAKLGFNVSVVEISEGLRKGGTPVDVGENTLEIVQRMGLRDQIESNGLPLRTTELKNAKGGTEQADEHREERRQEKAIEIERDILLDILFVAVENDVQFIFGDSIARLEEIPDGVEVSFQKRRSGIFDFVLGCDGARSDVRRMWFGPENEFSHFMKAYGSVTIVAELLIPENTSQMYKEPGKFVSLSTYNKKTDIILAFASETELLFDHRDKNQKKAVLLDNFSGMGWRTSELLDVIQHSDNVYFDKLTQIKMTEWAKGRVGLVGDAAYCASPAAGRGGSLAIDGAAALGEAFAEHPNDFGLAFATYDRNFRPFIEQVQADALNVGLAFLLTDTSDSR